MSSFLTPLLRNRERHYTLQNTRTGLVVADHLLTAFDSRSRRTGLLGRDSLADGMAMIIAPSNAVHTFFMRFAIDIAFVARDGRVVKTRPVVPPRRLAVAIRAYAVIELPTGALERSRTRPGDTLVLAAV